MQLRRKGAIRLTWSVYFLPLVLAVVAIVPGLNLLYSVHGGPAWLLLPFALPLSLVRLVFLYLHAGEERARIGRFAIVSLLAYFPVSYGACVLGARSIEGYLGAPIEAIFLWGLFTSPFGLAWSWRFFA